MRNVLHMLAFLTSSMLFAQVPEYLSKQIEKSAKFDDYAGSVYENKSYQKATIIDEKSGTFNTKLKYNIYTDALEFENGSQLYEVNKIATTHIRIQDNYYYFCSFKNEYGLKSTGYFVLLEQNESYRIYKKLGLKITDPQEMDSMTGYAATGKIKTQTIFYLEQDGVIMELPKNKKDILAAFSDKKDELKSYIKKEKIKIKKTEDLVRLVAKYNALKNMDANQSRSLLSNRVQNN